MKAAKKVSGAIKLVSVSVLTSLDNKALKEIGYNKNVKKLVLDQARLQKKNLDAMYVVLRKSLWLKKFLKKK